jgi:hypothetical protein
MSTIKQHLPGYVTGFENEVGTFTTTTELLAIWFVACFGRIDGFYRYSLSRENDITRLMAEYDAGTKWWVVGQIEGEPPDLPIWQPIRG